MCRNPYGIVMPCGVPRLSSWVGAANVPTSSCAVIVRSVCGAACSRQRCGNRPGALVWPGHKVRHKVLLRFWGVGGLEGVLGVWVGVLPCVSLSRFRSTPVGERRIYGLQKKKPLILTCHMRSGIRGGGKILGLDPYPLGERECMAFRRKSIDCEVSDEVRHSRRRSVLRHRSTPLGARMYGFPEETIVVRCQTKSGTRGG